MIVEALILSTAGFLFLRGFFHAGALTRMIGDGMKPRLVQPAPQPPVGTPWETYCRDAEAQEAELYRLCPSAFWLHPDGPLAPPTLPDVPQTVKPEWGPPCPNRCNAPLLVMAEHGGEASMWSCTLCGTDFTRAGKSRVAGKLARAKREIERRRERAAEMRNFELGLDSPQAAMRRQDEAFVEAWSAPPAIPTTKWVNPQATMRIAKAPPLPCGCSIETPIWNEQRVGYAAANGQGVRSSRCSQCKAWWYPASNDATGRTVGQGECVHFRDGSQSKPYFPPARPTR